MRNVFLSLALFGAATVVAAQSASTTPSTVSDIVVSHREERTSFDGPADRFTGHVRVDMLSTAHPPGRVSAGSVTFDPGARTAWHTHPLGQTLIITSGVGRVQRWGGPVQEVHPGDVVWIPAGVKHWHGASPSISMAHIAMTEQLDGQSVTWLEQVQEEPTPVTGVTPAAAPRSAAQKLFGDVAPGLAQLTDDVLYGDVWNRPGLSKRDRSLVTVSALIAMHRPDQLRSHLALAQQNGVTQQELTEAITQLAFYAGWPSAVTAATVAKDVFSRQLPPTTPQ
jgi:4-carboxymuconolactone decarboxylase